MTQLSLFPLTSGEDSYLHFEGDIPIDIPEGSLISLKRHSPLKIYSLGFQPAKSIPEISRWFLHKYGSHALTILDPFAGSGTTILESLRYGSSVYWLDYHPLSRLICQVKTTFFNLQQVLEIASQILIKANHQKDAPKTIHFKNKDFWFQKPVQEGLEILRDCILTVDKDIQPILWLAFASTVRKTSDMNDGMILAAKRSHIEEIPQRSRQDVYHYFKYYLEKALEALSEWQSLTPKSCYFAQQITPFNAKYIPNKVKFNAVITSPPYINAIDYVWASKFELHWLGMVKSDQDRLNLYAQEIGTERLSKKVIKDLGKTGHQVLDQLIADIYYGKNYRASQGQNHLRARVVYQYFLDMKDHFKSAFNCLENGGYYCFAVGDVSRICGVNIPVADLLTDLAHDIGLNKVFEFNLLLKNRRLNLPRNVDWAGTIKHDKIVVLEKKMNIYRNLLIKKNGNIFCSPCSNT